MENYKERELVRGRERGIRVNVNKRGRCIIGKHEIIERKMEEREIFDKKKRERMEGKERKRLRELIKKVKKQREKDKKWVEESTRERGRGGRKVKSKD
jgi:hypothetical protein